MFIIIKTDILLIFGFIACEYLKIDVKTLKFFLNIIM